MIEGHEPKCLAMILCDGVHVDPETGKRTYLGHFQSRRAKEFPFVMPRIVVALSLTECQPRTQLRIEVVKSDDGELIFQGGGTLESFDVLGELDFQIYLEQIPFAEPGEYRVELFAEDFYIAARNLRLLEDRNETTIE